MLKQEATHFGLDARLLGFPTWHHACQRAANFLCVEERKRPELGAWNIFGNNRPYNGARRSCPGRAGRGTAHGDRRDLQLTVRGVNQGKDSSWQSHPLKRLPKTTHPDAEACSANNGGNTQIPEMACRRHRRQAAVGVMSGVMFWVFDGMSYGLFPLLTLILPGSAALLHALFYFPPHWAC